MIEIIRSWVADVAGIVAFLAAGVGFVLGRRALRRQQASVDAARAAVEEAINDLRGRYLASLLSDARWAIGDFHRSCRESDWQRGAFGGDRLRAVMTRLLAVGGFSERELGKLRLALDDIKVVHDKVRRPQPKLSAQNLTALDEVLETIDHMHGRRAVPALAAGDPHE